MQEQSLRLSELESGQNLLLLLSALLFLLCFTLYTRNRIVKEGFQKLEETNQSKDELFAIVSHDLRSSVHSLLIDISKVKTLLSRQMISDAILETEQAELMAGNTQSLLNNLLYWSLSQTGQINFVEERLDVQALISQVCYDYLQVAASKNIDLRNVIDRHTHCTGDLNSLKIIFRNLIDNAIKFTPEFGVVTISAAQQQKRCIITVKDSGIGMDQKLVSAILNNENNRVQQDAYGRRSTGIGLWLVKSMTYKNDGEFSIYSEIGKGSSFTITLPG